MNSKEGIRRIVNFRKCLNSIPLSIKCISLNVCVIHTRLVNTKVSIANGGKILFSIYFLYVNIYPSGNRDIESILNKFPCSFILTSFFEY